MPDRDTSRARVALTKVPEITVIFWVLKLLTTGMGEAMSDFLGQHSVPIAAAIGISACGSHYGCSCASANTARRSTGSW
jgi:uncharacterized membrane-anchored protein